MGVGDSSSLLTKQLPATCDVSFLELELPPSLKSSKWSIQSRSHQSLCTTFQFNRRMLFECQPPAAPFAAASVKGHYWHIDGLTYARAPLFLSGRCLRSLSVKIPCHSYLKSESFIIKITFIYFPLHFTDIQHSISLDCPAATTTRATDYHGHFKSASNRFMFFVEECK